MVAYCMAVTVAVIVAVTVAGHQASSADGQLKFSVWKFGHQQVSTKGSQSNSETWSVPPLNYKLFARLTKLVTYKL